MTDSERFKTLVCLVQRISEVAHNERYVPYTHIFIYIYTEILAQADLLAVLTCL